VSKVKAYIRKANILYAMRDYTKAIEATQEASEHDTEHKHTAEISQQEMKCQQALFSQRGEESQEETLQRAMRDPEVAVSHYLLAGGHQLTLSRFHISVSGYYE
jgi:stress-induced-phosphoprotein 1